MYSNRLNAVLDQTVLHSQMAFYNFSVYILFLFPRLAHEVHMFIITRFGDE